MSLALIGNASAHKFGTKTCGSSRGIFDKETRRKPLAFAADAVYGDSKAVWYRETRAGAPMNSVVSWSKGGFGTETAGKVCPKKGWGVLGTLPEYTTALAWVKHVAGRGCECGIMTNQRMHGAALPR